MLPTSKNGCHFAINLSYFSPHHKNKFVNCVNSLKNSLAALAETKMANMLDFTRSGLPNVSQSKYRFFCGQIIAVCSLITHIWCILARICWYMYTTNIIMMYHIQCTVGYIVLSGLSKFWFRTLVPRKHFCPKSRCVNQVLHGFLEFELFKTRSNNYLNLWKTNKFVFLHQHVCNNVYNIWALLVHNTLLHHIDLYFIWCQCPLHIAP